MTQPRKPNFFIVGAPKCGTTAMHTYLGEHPDIFLPLYKEPHFFGSDLLGFRFDQFRGNKRKYLSLFRDAGDAKRVGEASPWYLTSERAAEEIAAYAPDAKIIIMLRKPADMMYSLYHQFRYSGNEVMPTFEDALDVEADRREGRQLHRMAHCVHGLFYRNMARYTDQIQRYFDAFGREQVCVIIYDDFRADTAGVYRQTLQFLDVDPSFTTTFDVINPNKKVRMGLMQRSLWSIGISPMILKDKLTYLATTSRWLPRSVRTGALQQVIQVYTRYEKRNPMNPETRARINAEFVTEVERLSALLGRDLTHWVRG